jgi:hypothetical protein
MNRDRPIGRYELHDRADLICCGSSAVTGATFAEVVPDVRRV